MNNKSTRRDFIKTASLLPLGVAAGATFGNFPASAQAPIKRVGQPRLKVSLNAYSFSKDLTPPATGGKPAMTLFDVLDFCAVHDFEGVDPTGYFFPGYPKVPADSYINDFKRRAFQLGIDITGTGVRNNFTTPDKEKRAADVQLVKDWIEVAAKMGAPVIRVFAGPEPQDPATWDQVAGWLVADLKQCVEHGRKHGVLVGVQNHGDFLKTAEHVLKIVKQVDSEWFGVILDIGNFKSADPYDDIARVVPYAVNFQIKESVFGNTSPVRTDLKKLMQIIRKGGYRGYLPIETLGFPGRENNPQVQVPQFLKEVRQAIEQTA